MKASLIYNPIAGPRDVHGALERLSSFFREHEWAVELKVTEKPGDATAMAREAAHARLDAVIVAGGDGTINEVVNGLVGTETALGVLPVGTGNLWAKQLDVPTYTLANPFRLREAATGLIEGRVRLIDVGCVDGLHFLCWAGIGLDAQVTTRVEPRERHTKRLGALPYLIAAVLVARDFRGVRTYVDLDGDLVRARTLLILVNNIQQYGGLLDVAPAAKLDDGLLDVFIFKGLGFQYVVRHVLKVLSQRYLQDPEIEHRQARHIKIRAEYTIPVQVDGDPIGTTPATLTVVPQSLRVIVPPDVPSNLFVGDSDVA